MEKERQISKQNNMKVILMMCAFCMRTYPAIIFINFRKFYRPCTFWSEIFKMITEGAKAFKEEKQQQR